MMKNFLFLPVIAAFLISCSNSDKFDINNKPKIEFNIFYQSYKVGNKPHIYAYADITPRDGEYYYYWVIDGKQYCYNYDLDYNCYSENITYGEHILEFVLIDSFGDALSEYGIIRINEPLKITLLSPVELYEAAKTDTIKFQYKISGIDTWEEFPQVIVYISKDKEVWENGKQIQDNFLVPQLNEQVYYWGVKAFTERDSAFSEIRSVWIKK